MNSRAVGCAGTQGCGCGYHPYALSSDVPPPPVGRPTGYAPKSGPRPVPGEEVEPNIWAKQPLHYKAAIFFGSAVIGALLISYLSEDKGRRKYRSNYRSRLPKRRAPDGRIITVKGGRRFGHRIPPKHYWDMGARRKQDFSWPDGYKYPLVFRDSRGRVNLQRTKRHIRSAKAYLRRSKHLYPMDVRRVIARRINEASRTYGAGPTVVAP